MKMSRILWMLPLFVILAGCNTTQQAQLIVKEAVVTLPPEQLLNCPLTKLPDTFHSNKDVALLLVQTYSNSVKCKRNMDAVKSFLQQEKTTVEKTSK